jgi:hypothetical protein
LPKYNQLKQHFFVFVILQGSSESVSNCFNVYIFLFNVIADVDVARFSRFSAVGRFSDLQELLQQTSDGFQQQPGCRNNVKHFC